MKTVKNNFSNAIKMVGVLAGTVIIAAFLACGFLNISPIDLYMEAISVPVNDSSILDLQSHQAFSHQGNNDFSLLSTTSDYFTDSDTMLSNGETEPDVNDNLSPQRGVIEYYSLYSDDKDKQIIYSDIANAGYEGKHFDKDDTSTWLGGYDFMTEYQFPTEDLNTILQEVAYDYPILSAYRTGEDNLYAYLDYYGHYSFDTPVTSDDNYDVEAMYEKIDNKAKEIDKQAVNDSDGYTYKYINSVYEQLCSNIKYSDGVNDTEHANDIYGALFEGESKCYGDASAFKYILDKENIPNFIASGVVNGTEQHAWNVVWIDNSWKVCDLTIGSNGPDNSLGSVQANEKSIFTGVYTGCLMNQDTYENTYSVAMDQRSQDLENYYQQEFTAQQ